MNSVAIKRIRLKNFRSFVNEAFELSQCSGLKLLSGENLVHKRLGANGAGKSSLWEALVWCLYGFGIKGARTSSLISWNKDYIEVTVDLTIGSTWHIITRTGPPGKILVNGKLGTQEQVDALLGLSRLRFVSSVIFGQGVSLFPDISVSERGELFDEVLNLELWSKCSEQAGIKCRTLEQDLHQEKVRLSYLNGRLSSLPTDDELEKKALDWLRCHQLELDRVMGCRDKWDVWKKDQLLELKKQSIAWRRLTDEALEDKARELEILEGELTDLESVLSSIDITERQQMLSEKQKNLNNLIVEIATASRNYFHLDAERTQIMTTHKFWIENDTCPTCEQPITPEKKEDKLLAFTLREKTGAELVSSAKLTLAELEAKKKTESDAIQLIHDELTRDKERQKSLSNEISRVRMRMSQVETDAEKLMKAEDPYQAQHASVVKQLNPYEADITNLLSIPNPVEQEIKDAVMLRTGIQQEITNRTNTCSTLEANLVAAEYWKHGFKKIRLYFVQQILQALEVEIKSAISALGLVGWSVGLSTETETKSGTMKLGIQLTVKSPTAVGSWEAWSGGEAQRLRLAVALALGSLIQRAAGVFYNFTVLDEPTSWLSPEGIEDLLECLQNYAETHQKSVWILDHRALQHSGFTEIWLVTKSEDGSKISKLAG